VAVPDVLRNRDFNLYWAGVVLSQIGTRGTVAANYFQVYALTGSVVQTGLVGAGQAAALLVLSPIGGAYADRIDRRKLLMWAQVVSLVVALVLAVLTLTGRTQAWHVILSVLFTTAAATFDQPARQALIPAMVPKHQLAQAIALLNPSREVAVLVGPALAGVFIAVGGRSSDPSPTAPGTCCSDRSSRGSWPWTWPRPCSAPIGCCCPLWRSTSSTSVRRDTGCCRPPPPRVLCSPRT
jgi:MFS family permease